MFCKGNIIDASKAGLLKIVEYYIKNGTNINDVDGNGKFVNVNVYLQIYVNVYLQIYVNVYLQISNFHWGGLILDIFI